MINAGPRAYKPRDRGRGPGRISTLDAFGAYTCLSRTPEVIRRGLRNFGLDNRQIHTILTSMEEFGAIGPKMKALPNDRWRRAVVAYLEGGRKNYGGQGGHNSLGYSAAYRAAGFDTTNENTIKRQAHTLFHDIRVQEAVIEESKRRAVLHLPLAIDVHTEIMLDPQHKDRFNAARSIMDRAGLHAVTEQHSTLSVTMTADDRAKAVMLAERLGVPLEKLVGNRMAKQIAAPTEEPMVTDAEFEEVPDEPEPARVARLEDIL